MRIRTTLPRHHVHPESTDDTMNSRRRVMVVEDDQDLRDAVGEVLGDAGFEVSDAANGALAMGALQRSKQLPAVILLDIMMPTMDGEQFLREMRKDP